MPSSPTPASHDHERFSIIITTAPAQRSLPCERPVFPLSSKHSSYHETDTGGPASSYCRVKNAGRAPWTSAAEPSCSEPLPPAPLFRSTGLSLSRYGTCPLISVCTVLSTTTFSRFRVSHCPGSIQPSSD